MKQENSIIERQPPFSKKHVLFLSAILLLGMIMAFSLTTQKQKNQATPQITPSPSPIPTQQKEAIVPGEVIVKFKSSVSLEVIQRHLTSLNASISKPPNRLGMTVLKVQPHEEQLVIDTLTADGLVEYAEPNYIYEPRFTPNDTDLGKQWALQTVQAEKAWDITRGQGIKVADLDSGIDLKHPDLSSKIVAQKNFVGGNSVQDTQKHGTHTAGILAAVTNNGQGISSICPGCQLVIAKTDFRAAAGAEAVIWATDQGAKVISMSWGSKSHSKALEDALAYAWNKGVLPVAAVQNENINNSKDYPSSFQTVMNVTNTEKSDKKTAKAGYGTWVWIAAPGTGIYSTIPKGYGNISGTSMSTPLVAGTAALVWSTQYGTSPQAVRQRLCDTADKISGTGSQFKCGRLNAFKAVQGNTAGTPNQPTAQPPTTAPQKQITTAPTAVPNAPRQTEVKPTFTAIGDCITNGNCPPTEPPFSPPKEIAQLPDKQAPEQNIPAKTPQNLGGKEGLLQLLIQLILLLLRRA